MQRSYFLNNISILTQKLDDKYDQYREVTKLPFENYKNKKKKYKESKSKLKSSQFNFQKQLQLNPIYILFLKIFANLPKGYLFEWKDDLKTIMCAHGSWDLENKEVNQAKKYDESIKYTDYINSRIEFPSISWGDFANLQTLKTNIYIDKESRGFQFGEMAIQNFKEINPHIIAHLSGHQDTTRFVFFPNTHTASKASVYKYDPMYGQDAEQLYTIKNVKQKIPDMNGTTYNLTEEMRNMCKEEKIFVGISSICPPFKDWARDATTLAYMSYGIDT